MSTAKRPRLSAVAAAVLVAAGLTACGDTTVVEDPTPDGGEGSTGGSSTGGDAVEYPDDLVVEVRSLSGSVPPPHDSLETVTIGPDGLTYTAGSRYEDEPRFSETLEPEDGDLEEVMVVWESLDIPAETPADGYDDSHSSGGAGGDYVITSVTGTGYDSTATGDQDPIWELVEAALDQVPQDVRDEGLAAIEEYNDSEE